MPYRFKSYFSIKFIPHKGSKRRLNAKKYPHFCYKTLALSQKSINASDRQRRPGSRTGDYDTGIMAEPAEKNYPCHRHDDGMGHPKLRNSWGWDTRGDKPAPPAENEKKSGPLCEKATRFLLGYLDSNQE